MIRFKKRIVQYYLPSKSNNQNKCEFNKYLFYSLNFGKYQFFLKNVG